MRPSASSYLVTDKTTTRFSNRGEEFRRGGRRRGDHAAAGGGLLCERGANHVVAGPFKAFAVCDGRLVTGRQYSACLVAHVDIDMLVVWLGRRRPWQVRHRSWPASGPDDSGWSGTCLRAGRSAGGTPGDPVVPSGATSWS